MLYKSKASSFYLAVTGRLGRFRISFWFLWVHTLPPHPLAEAVGPVSACEFSKGWIGWQHGGRRRSGHGRLCPTRAVILVLSHMKYHVLYRISRAAFVCHSYLCSTEAQPTCCWKRSHCQSFKNSSPLFLIPVIGHDSPSTVLTSVCTPNHLLGFMKNLPNVSAENRRTHRLIFSTRSSFVTGCCSSCFRKRRHRG